MSELATELRKLAALKRTDPNFTKIQDKLAEVRQHANEAGEFPGVVAAAVTALRELRDLIGQTDAGNPLVTLTMDDAEAALALLPGGAGYDPDDIATLLDEAEGAAETYGEVRAGSEYDKGNRDEAFDELCNAIENIANWLDPKGAPGQ